MDIKEGFTILEILIVIVILGILATLGIQHYIPTFERVREQEACSNLQLLASAERIWRMENDSNSYVACQCNCTGTGSNCCDNSIRGCNTLLRLQLNPRDWLYWVVVTPPPDPTFTAFAERVGSGGYLDCRYSINNTQTQPVVNTQPCIYRP